MLPLTLISLLLQATFGFGQTHQTQLSLNAVANFSTKALPNPPVFSLPVSTDVSISVAVCSTQPSNALPRFFVTNDTSIKQPGPDDLGNPSVFELNVDQFGFAEWTGGMSSGGVFAVSIGSAAQTSFEVGVSDSGPLHELLDTLPLLGDTTSNQALLFSPAFGGPIQASAPTYPNYTLPPANLSFPQGPSQPPNFNMIIGKTGASGLPSLRTGCALRAAAAGGGANGVLTEGAAESDGLWLRDLRGWRWQWLVEGLTPLTNYTAFAIQDQAKVSGPINFVTKSGGFNCPIVHSLPYCPSTNYAVPISPPAQPATAHDSTTLPDNVTQPLLETLTNFTTSLTTFPCGRDMYSPLVTCEDCQATYRKWLCAVWFPRCTEGSPSSPQSDNNNITLSQSSSQVVLSALLPMPSGAASRSPALPPFPASIITLLPCLETCTATDRACPTFLGFKCPVPEFTARQSYGVGYIDSGESGRMGGGSTGTAQDRWGNVWCNEG